MNSPFGVQASPSGAAAVVSTHCCVARVLEGDCATVETPYARIERAAALFAVSHGSGSINPESNSPHRLKRRWMDERHARSFLFLKRTEFSSRGENLRQMDRRPLNLAFSGARRAGNRRISLRVSAISKVYVNSTKCAKDVAVLPELRSLGKFPDQRENTGNFVDFRPFWPPRIPDNPLDP
jgi:hypothetical protein